MELDFLRNILMEHLKSSALKESVREWMVIIKSGNYGNKRVVYSTDKKQKADEVFLDYRDKYPEYVFRVMTKSAFRDMFHRFPEYLPNHIKDKLFKKEDEIEINPDFKKPNYIYDPDEENIYLHKKYDDLDDNKEFRPKKPRHKTMKVKRY